MPNNVLFNKPVVIVSGKTVKRYYVNAYATIQDNYNPMSVLKVCSHYQKTHKGEVFRYASNLDTVAYEILKGLAV